MRYARRRPTGQRKLSMPSVQEAQALAQQAIQYDNARDIHNAIATYRRAIEAMRAVGVSTPVFQCRSLESAKCGLITTL